VLKGTRERGARRGDEKKRVGVRGRDGMSGERRKVSTRRGIRWKSKASERK